MAPSTIKARKAALPAARHVVRRTALVDTDIQSYDRTDPFHAINSLRRLIGSLATRIGGCQYKLTPDEHKISLHLLTIIEPFVGLSPSRRSLTRQPTEILDAIVFHVESKRDLLSLALSCHRLHSVIFPRHHDYRVLCAKASSLCLWNHLIVNRALARNVRTLEIIDERSSRPLLLPADVMKTDTDLESSDDELTLHLKHEKLFVSALTKMTALKTFHWSSNHSTIPLEKVWVTLTKCDTISQVNITDNLAFLPYTSDAAKPNPKAVSALPELKSVALQATKHVFGSTKTPALARISGMLANCPNLETLNIGYEYRSGQGQHLPAADDFFLCSRWPCLRFLSLANLRCSSSHSLESASAFFAVHSNLEILHLDLPLDGFRTGSDNGTGPMLVLSSNSLPKLRELKCGKTIATAILSCPTDSPRPLEVLKGITLSGPDWDGSFFTSLRPCGATIQRIELAGWRDLDDIRRLVECVPKLTWLDVNKHKPSREGTEQALHGYTSSRRYDASTSLGKGTSSLSTGLGVATNVTEWATVLAPLTELTTFIGIKFFYEVSTLTLATLASASPTSLSPSALSRVRRNDMVAAVLGNKCTKLRRVDHWEDTGTRVIVLTRDGNEVKWEVKRMKL